VSSAQDEILKTILGALMSDQGGSGEGIGLHRTFCSLISGNRENRQTRNELKRDWENYGMQL